MRRQIFTRLLGAQLLALCALAASGTTLAAPGESARDLLVLTSTNGASGNAVLVFRIEGGASPALPLEDTLPTGGKGGAGGNAGSVQFENDLGAVANFGSNSVTRLVRNGSNISVAGTIGLAAGCTGPDSVALKHTHLYVVGANCAETHAWPSGTIDGSVVALPDNSAGQIAAGRSWAAVTLKSGSLLALPLTWNGELTGAASSVALPSDANNTPLGAAFWGNVLAFNPAHSPDSLALVNEVGEVTPIAGPTPSFPSNAPCWIAKGPGNIWYTGNSPGQAISIFFTDSASGVFYKSVALPGTPTDVSVSRDMHWLAVIYSSGGAGYLAVYSIDDFGDLNWVATSEPVGSGSLNGVAFSD